MPFRLGEFTTRMEYCHPVTRRDLRGLAAEELPSFRSIRYGGDNLSLTLETFSPEDQKLILHLYNLLAELYRDLKAHRNAPGLATAIASAFARKVDLEKLTKSIHSLGKSMTTKKGDRLFHQVLHDLRGGALTTLLMRLDLLASGISSSNDADQIFFLVRDHLKIMRNAVSDVDTEWRIEDEGRKLHHLSLLTEKWERAVHYRQKQPVRITFTLDSDGNVAERCLEFSALDRVSYNMINNAVRFAEDFRVEFTALEYLSQEPKIFDLQ